MKIGEALRTVRLQLGLTQIQMCGDIVSRSFYAKIEGEKNEIGADSLFRILFLHDIDISEFISLIQKSYTSNENILRNKLRDKMSNAFSTGDTDALTNYCQKIVSSTSDNILKLRSIVTLAYFEGDLESIDPHIKEKIKKEFDDGDNWSYCRRSINGCGYHSNYLHY